MIRLTCKNCQAKFILPDSSGGQKGKCPKCGAAIVVPSPTEAELKGSESLASTQSDPIASFLASDIDEDGEIPLADEVDEPAAKPAQRPPPRPSATGLVIMPVQDISLVDFQHASILDGPVIEAIGRDLYALVDQQARRKIILDFQKVRFLSSQMLGVIITLHKKSAAIKGRVVLCGVRSDLMKVFTLMKIDKVLRIVDTEGRAMEILGVPEIL